MRTNNPQYARSEYHTQLAKMSFDKIFDLTAGVYFNFFLNNTYMHSSYEIKDLVDTDFRNIVYDPPVARINHICRGLSNIEPSDKSKCCPPLPGAPAPTGASPYVNILEFSIHSTGGAAVRSNISSKLIFSRRVW